MKKTPLIAIVIVLMLCTAAVVWSQGVWVQKKAVVSTSSSDGTSPVTRTVRSQVIIPGETCPVSAIQMQCMPLFGVLTSEELGLDPEQIMHVSDIMSSCDEAMKPFMEQAKEETKRLREMLTADQVDIRQIQQQAMRADQAEAAILNAEIDKWMQIRLVLSPQQLTMLRELVEKDSIFPNISIDTDDPNNTNISIKTS